MNLKPPKDWLVSSFVFAAVSMANIEDSKSNKLLQPITRFSKSLGKTTYH